MPYAVKIFFRENRRLVDAERFNFVYKQPNRKICHQSTQWEPHPFELSFFGETIMIMRQSGNRIRHGIEFTCILERFLNDYRIKVFIFLYLIL